MTTQPLRSRFPREGILDAVAAHYAMAEQAVYFEERAKRLQRHLKTRLSRSLRLEANLRKDLARIEEAATYKRKGELILANLHKLRKGMAEADVPDYFEPGTPMVRLTLDPSLTPTENAERYFKKYRRFHSAKDDVSLRLNRTAAVVAETRRLLCAVEELCSSLERKPEELSNEIFSKKLDELAALEAIVGIASETTDGYGRARTERQSTRDTSKNRRVRIKERLPYLEFIARNGNDRILVGRGAKDNDRLTFVVARGNDIWLHVRDFSGPHVIIRRGTKDEISSETLVDAATLAVHYSRQARAEGRADVMWAYRKNVRKARNAAPGTVHVADGHTLRIEIDPERIKRLFAGKK